MFQEDLSWEVMVDAEEYRTNWEQDSQSSGRSALPKECVRPAGSENSHSVLNTIHLQQSLPFEYYPNLRIHLLHVSDTIIVIFPQLSHLYHSPDQSMSGVCSPPPVSPPSLLQTQIPFSPCVRAHLASALLHHSAQHSQNRIPSSLLMRPISVSHRKL